MKPCADRRWAVLCTACQGLGLASIKASRSSVSWRTAGAMRGMVWVAVKSAAIIASQPPLIVGVADADQDFAVELLAAGRRVAFPIQIELGQGMQTAAQGKA